VVAKKNDRIQSPPPHPASQLFRKGDVFVLFGELFGRGYVNGLIDEARKAGMTIVGITVGRRNDDGSPARPDAEEHAEAEEKLGGRIINVPLMAGFDMDAPAGEQNPTEMLSGVTLKSWQEDKLDWDKIEALPPGRRAPLHRVGQPVHGRDRQAGPGRRECLLRPHHGRRHSAIKAFLAIANRIYKGRGERFMSSRALLDSDLGKLILMNFDEVTANTLKYLIDASAPIRERVEAKAGGEVRYTAYGYHGTEDPDRRRVRLADLHQLHPGLRQDAPGVDRRSRLEPGRRRDRVQLPGNPHQFVRHLRRRRTVAVPAADRPQEGRRRRLGPAAVGDLPGTAGRRRVAAIDPRQARALQLQTPPAPSSATSKPGRWTTRRNWPT
jgi:hypothetical protein